MNKIDKMIKNIEAVDQYIAKSIPYIPCLVDCTDCCYDYFYATLPEFYLTLYGVMKLPSNLDFYYNKALVTFNYFERHINQEIKKLDPLTSVGHIKSQREDFSEGEYINYQNLPPCIMLNNGRCSIYKYRPNTCRKYGTLVTCEYLDNPDYQDDEEVSYNIYPLIRNTLLIRDGESIETKKYPLWFYYSYFFREELRPYLLSNLNKLMTLSEEDFIEQVLL